MCCAVLSHSVLYNFLWFYVLSLKFQYVGHLMCRDDLLEKTLILGEIEGRRRRGQQKISWLDGITDSMDMSLSKLQEIVSGRTGMSGVLQSMGPQRVRHDWTTTTAMDHSPPGSSVHGDSPGKNTAVGCLPPGDLPNPGIEPRYPTL